VRLLLRCLLWGFAGAVAAAAAGLEGEGIRTMFWLAASCVLLARFAPSIHILLGALWLPGQRRAGADPPEPPRRRRDPEPPPKPPGQPAGLPASLEGDCVTALMSLGIDRRRAAAAVREARELGADTEKTVMFRALQSLNVGGRRT
jgi:hypothetical protein